MSSPQVPSLSLCCLRESLGARRASQNHFETKPDALSKLWVAPVANAPVWMAAALHRKCFSSLSVGNSEKNMIPCLLAHVWVGSSSQLSRLGLAQKVCQKPFSSSSHAGGVLCCQPMAWLCAGTLSLVPARNITSLSSTHRGISEDAQQGLGQHGVGIFKPWQRELSVGRHWQWELMKSEIQTHPSLFHISKPWRQQLL